MGCPFTSYRDDLMKAALTTRRQVPQSDDVRCVAAAVRGSVSRRVGPWMQSYKISNNLR